MANTSSLTATEATSSLTATEATSSLTVTAPIVYWVVSIGVAVESNTDQVTSTPS